MAKATAVRNIRDDHQKAFLKIFNSLCGRFNRWQVWQDFVMVTAIEISNATDKQNAPERTKTYQTIISKYSDAEQEKFAELLGEVIMGMEQNLDQDFLGELYMLCELGNDASGQFFTPYDVCRCMVEISGESNPAAENAGFFSVADPACGAGALLIAFANLCRRKNICYHDKVLFVAQDIDLTVGLMCYMPESLDIVFTPLITMILCLVPYILIIMPATGYVSTALCWVVEKLCMSDILIVRIIAGYVSTALFLPMVAMGMHHGLVALYSVQLESFGYVTLYPALAMAGAGQVGAAVAIYFKAKKCGNTRLKNVITGALPAGLLGIGEPLIYGVTLPMGKPFISAGLGAGFGGAFVMAMQVAATAWGPSGLLALFVMTAGPHGVAASVGCYAVGLVICYIMGFIVTNAMVSVEDVANA